MGFGKRKYNNYRKRSFSMSNTQRKKYAETMNELEEAFDKMEDWYLSSMKDSCYKDFGKYEVRLSNHSADNKYHNLENGKLLVNIKASKQDFAKIIENNLDNLLDKINKLELDQYRFINVIGINGNINCFLKGFKTKKDVF